ncbi:hypothetical protein, partial [Enterococcus faecalis]|uniref:hypothetical protein n=1 Tax=Enterococcus faecalis TaxID=1351 RepID=UPI00403F3107
GLFGGQVLAVPLLALDEALRESGANALAITATDAGVALIEASVALAIILLRVTLYGQAAGQKAA